VAASADRQRELAPRAFALIASAALIAAPWSGHVDDFDAQIYLVVARNLARDHAWFALRYLPSVFPVFREHLPFGFWPAAAAIRLFGEWSVPAVYALFTLLAIAAAGRIAEHAGGPRAAVAAILLLGTCESIWRYGGRPLLDPPLWFFATASVDAALRDRWRAAALLGAVAVMVKGPYGLLPLACVAVARLPDVRLIAAAILAAVPLAVFLLIDPAGGWRSGYLLGQLLASATGARSDGVGAWWFLPAVILRRFWPGLPFAALGLWRAIGDKRLRSLALTCVLICAFLVLPARKWGNHAYVAFPVLAALGGAAVAPRLVKLRLEAITAALAGIALVFCFSGLGARLLRPPCAFASGLREPLDVVRPGESIAVVSKGLDTVAQLAAEHDVIPAHLAELPQLPATRFAVAEDGATIPPAWAVLAHGGGFALLRAR
jgi:4-amino-4-deoxy-L-arabinose transferase-like glycosyltransferase